MPHLTLEYTRNLKDVHPTRTLEQLNRALIASGHFQPADIKSRAIALDDFLVGLEPEGHAFVHVRVAILSGRTLETRQALTASLLETLRAQSFGGTGLQVQLCAQVDEIERESYAKTVLAQGSTT